MKALTIGTLASLHKSPEQQLTSHSMSSTVGLEDLQCLDLAVSQADEWEQPLA